MQVVLWLMPRTGPDKSLEKMIKSHPKAESVKVKFILKIASAWLLMSVEAFKILLQHQKLSWASKARKWNRLLLAI